MPFRACGGSALAVGDEAVEGVAAWLEVELDQLGFAAFEHRRGLGAFFFQRRLAFLFLKAFRSPRRWRRHYFGGDQMVGLGADVVEGDLDDARAGRVSRVEDVLDRLDGGFALVDLRVGLLARHCGHRGRFGRRAARAFGVEGVVVARLQYLGRPSRSCPLPTVPTPPAAKNQSREGFALDRFAEDLRPLPRGCGRPRPGSAAGPLRPRCRW